MMMCVRIGGWGGGGGGGGGGGHGKHIYWADLIGGSFAQIFINLDAKEVQN